MSGELRSNGRVPPTAAESGKSTVAILQTVQPTGGTLERITAPGRDALVRTGTVPRYWLKFHQRQHRPRRVVRVGDAAGQVGPGPAAGIGVRVGVHCLVLLVQQPLANCGAIVFRQIVTQRVDGQRRDPRRQICVDRPTPVSADGVDDELHALPRDGVIGSPHPGQTHRDETRQRGGFQKPTVGRLNLLQPLETRLDRQPLEEPRDRVPGFSKVIPDLPDRDQRRQGVTHDRQANRFVELRRQAREVERQRQHVFPVHESRQGAMRENRNRKRAVFAVSLQNRSNAADFVDVGDGFLNDVAMMFVLAGCVKGRPAEHRRRDVRNALGRVSPATVAVLMLSEPADAAIDERLQRVRRAGGASPRSIAVVCCVFSIRRISRLTPAARVAADHFERHHRGGRGQRGCREFAFPMPVGVPFREQGIAGGHVAALKAGGVNGHVGRRSSGGTTDCRPPPTPFQRVQVRGGTPPLSCARRLAYLRSMNSSPITNPTSRSANCLTSLLSTANTSETCWPPGEAHR